MATIIERPRADGTTAYLVQIVVKRDGKIAHRESRTFDRRPAAATWAKAREKELANPDGLRKAKVGKKTLADAIDKYIAESSKAIGRTKSQVLTSVKNYKIAEMLCGDIASTDIVDFANDLAVSRQPQTVANYLSHLSSIFAIARPAWGIPLDEKEMRDAQKVLKRLGVVAKTKQRHRRPTLDELNRLLEHYAERAIKYPQSVNMAPIILFAIFSTRRQDEITRILWDDLDEDHSRVLVRDMKDPGEKIGNNVWCDLPPEALALIKAQPKSAPEIFPFETRTVSSSFTKTCSFLEIDDLHFHDLRHEGVSRLFELGWTIPHVAAVSGHRSWNSLKRYTHIKQREVDKYAGWKHRPAVTKD